jgi:membrane-associated HD superfamily phosphohydrolase
MRWFLLHIAIKDLSFMMFYFVIMKYDLTNETYLPKTLSNFPGAPDMTLLSMVEASLIYNLIPLIISLITYYPIVYLTKKLLKTQNWLSLITAGFILTLTNPLIHIIANKGVHNNYYETTAEIIAWTLCFIISILTYYLLNMTRKHTSVK